MAKTISIQSAVRPSRQPRHRHRSHRLVTVPDRQREQALELTSSALGICFPGDYVNRGILYALQDQQGDMHGGAIVVSDPPFRSLQGIPNARAVARCLPDPNQIAEINGVWLSEQMRSPFASFLFWTQLLEELLQTGAGQFLFTFDRSNSRMSALMQWAAPVVVYSGRTRQLPGMKSVSEETIALLDRPMIESFLTLINQLGSRQLPPRQADLADRLGGRSRRRAA